MISTATTSIYRLARGDVFSQPVMKWSCPVPFFGRLGESTVATLGINPSNREFVDAGGMELHGADRRFPTLHSLGLQAWEDASSLDVESVLAACEDYFSANPYARWFNVLDGLIRPTGASFYSANDPAAHLDLVPYATHAKWGSLRHDQRQALLLSGHDLLGELLRDSQVELLILNGASVVRQFEEVADLQLHREYNSSWDLPRRGSKAVRGVGYSGVLNCLGPVDLGRPITIVGFNHNLQSSFGVTRRAIEAISDWVVRQL